MAAQAQNHVTYNEALRILDGIVQLSVKDRDLTVPPASPADGDRYIVGSGATGMDAHGRKEPPEGGRMTSVRGSPSRFIPG